MSKGYLAAMLSPLLFMLALALLRTEAADHLLGGDGGLGLFCLAIGPAGFGTAWYLRKAAQSRTGRMREFIQMIAFIDVVIGVVGILVLLFLLNNAA